MSKQQKTNRFVGVVLETLGGPLLWGLIGTFAFYFLVQAGVLSHPLLRRYTAGHPVEYVEVALFFVGIAAIFGRGWNAVSQAIIASGIEVQHRSQGGLRDRIAHLISQLESMPDRIRRCPLAERLNQAVMHIQRSDSTEQLEDELKYLSDMEAERAHDGYALVRMIIWATPMLGFLGTVIGITLALGDLSPEALVNSPKEAMEGLLSGLSVAFDTTALALTLSIVLMFAQFLTQQLDTQLLALVDRQATELMAPYLRRSSNSEDPNVETTKRLAKSMMDAVESNTRRQTEQWLNAMEQSHEQWVQMIQNAGGTVHKAVAGAVQEGLQAHAENLSTMEQATVEAVSENWKNWQLAASEMFNGVKQQQAELIRQGEVLNRVLDATGDVMKLEDALNQNLRALSGAKNFEDTVMSLSAAIQLLSSRLSKPMPRDLKMKLEALGQERAA